MPSPQNKPTQAGFDVLEWQRRSSVLEERLEATDTRLGTLTDGSDADSLHTHASKVSGPGSATDNAVARFDSTTGKLIQDSNVTINDVDNLFIPGSLDLFHTAEENDDFGFRIVLDADGFSDVKAVDINFVTGVIVAGEDEEVVLINIDQSISDGGRVSGLMVIATSTGSAEVGALGVGATVHPIKQSSGAFADLDSLLDIAADVLTALSVGGDGDIAVFENDNESMTFGLDEKFEELEFILDTAASNPGIAPTFEYSTGEGTWAMFGPADGTNAMRNTGIIAWLITDIPGWLVGTGSEFLIRITRTRSNLNTTPILDLVQAEAGADYEWNADGDVHIRGLQLADRSAPSSPGAGLGELYKLSGNDGAWWKPDAAGPAIDLTAALAGVNTVTGTSYTVLASDDNKVIRCTNGSAVTLSINTGDLPIGFACSVVQWGAGQVDVAGGTTTIRKSAAVAGTKTSGQYARVDLVMAITDELILSGDAAA